MDLGRGQPVGDAAEPIRRPRREGAHEAGHAGQRLGVEIERQTSARLRVKVVDASADIEGRAAEIAHREPLDVQYASVELDPGIDRLRVDTGDFRFADIEHERDLVRHLEARVRCRRLGERRQGIDVERGGVDFAVEHRRTGAGGPAIGEPPGDVLLIECRCHPLEREPVTPDGDHTARAERLRRARGRTAAAFEAGHQHLQIMRLEACGSAEG